MHARSLRGLLRVLLCCSATVSLAFSATSGDLFVDVSRTTGNDDGSSWADAFQGLDGARRALDLAQPGDRVFVAQGVYVPDPDLPVDLDAAFELGPGVRVYGGCLGTESEPDQRPPAGTAPTVFSGDNLLNNGQPMGWDDNAYHVVRANQADAGSLLDRITIRHGWAHGLSNLKRRGGGLICAGGEVRLVDCEIGPNNAVLSGSSIYLGGGSRLTLESCTLVDDSSSNDNALHAYQSSACTLLACRVRNTSVSDHFLDFEGVDDVRVLGCEFWNMSSQYAPLHVHGGSAALVDGCTFVDTRTSWSLAPCIEADPGTVLVSHSILWPDLQAIDPQPIHEHLVVVSSLVQGGHSGPSNSAQAPLFVDPDQGDLRLLPGSPGIDGADGATFLLGFTVDLNGLPRRVDDPRVPDVYPSAPAPDIGAHELQPALIGEPHDFCAALPNSTGEPADAFAIGSVVLDDGDLYLGVESLPPQQFGYFLTSRNEVAYVSTHGVVCLGLPFFRFDQHILDSGPGGLTGMVVDLGDLPQGQVFLPGESWSFQYWYRDGFASNLSDAVRVTWE